MISRFYLLISRSSWWRALFLYLITGVVAALVGALLWVISWRAGLDLNDAIRHHPVLSALPILAAVVCARIVWRELQRRAKNTAEIEWRSEIRFEGNEFTGSMLAGL
jgi:H+/Cl- antiporter ClcA